MAKRLEKKRTRLRRGCKIPNLQEFSECCLHVHLSRSIRVEINLLWTTEGDVMNPTGKVCFRKWERRMWDKVVDTGDAFSSARRFELVYCFEERGSEVYGRKIGWEERLGWFEWSTLETHVESLLQHLSTCDSMADKLGLRGGIVFGATRTLLATITMK